MSTVKSVGVSACAFLLFSSLTSTALYAVDNVKNVECKAMSNGQKGDLPCKYKCPTGKTCTMKLVVRVTGTPPVIETPITLQGDQEYTITENAANSGLLAHSCTYPA